MAIDLSAFDEFEKTKQPSVDTSAFDVFHGIRTGEQTGAQKVVSNFLQGVQDVSQKTEKNFDIAAEDIKKGDYGRGAAQFVSTVGRTVLGTTGLAGKTVGDIGVAMVPGSVKNAYNKSVGFFNKIIDKTTEPVVQSIQQNFPKFVSDVKNKINDKELNADLKKVGDIIKDNPDVADTFKDVFNTISLAVGAESTIKSLATIKSELNAVKPALKEKIANAIEQTTTRLSSKLDANIVKNNLEAIDPVLSKGKTIKALEDVVKGGRGVELPKTFFGEKNLVPSERTLKIASRVSNPIDFSNSDVSPLKKIELFKDKPVENLVELRKALVETENKMVEIIKAGDVDLLYNADKSKLFDSFTDAIKDMPRGFKDSKKQFRDVFDYASNLVKDAPDDLEGLISVKREFMSKARKQYPNAFVNGTIDTSSPIGSAIKSAYDSMSEHIYNLTPVGSDIRKLIRREGDILTMTEMIAPKAEPFVGKGLVGKAELKYPGSTRAAKYVAGGAIGGAVTAAGYDILK